MQIKEFLETAEVIKSYVEAGILDEKNSMVIGYDDEDRRHQWKQLVPVYFDKERNEMVEFDRHDWTHTVREHLENAEKIDTILKLKENGIEVLAQSGDSVLIQYANKDDGETLYAYGNIDCLKKGLNLPPGYKDLDKTTIVESLQYSRDADATKLEKRLVRFDENNSTNKSLRQSIDASDLFINVLKERFAKENDMTKEQPKTLQGLLAGAKEQKESMKTDHEKPTSKSKGQEL